MSEISETSDFKLWATIVCQGKKSLDEVAVRANENSIIETANDSRNRELALLTMCSQGSPDQVAGILQKDKTNY